MQIMNEIFNWMKSCWFGGSLNKFVTFVMGSKFLGLSNLINVWKYQYYDEGFGIRV